MAFSQRSVDKRISLLDAGAYGSGTLSDVLAQATVHSMGVKGDHMYLVARRATNPYISKLYKMDLSSMELNLMIDFMERGDVNMPNFGAGFVHEDYIFLAQSEAWNEANQEGVIVRVSIADNRLIMQPSRIQPNDRGIRVENAFTNGVYGFLPCFGYCAQHRYGSCGDSCSKVYRFQLDFQGGISEIDLWRNDFGQASFGLCSGQICYVSDAKGNHRLARAKQSPVP